MEDKSDGSRATLVGTEKTTTTTNGKETTTKHIKCVEFEFINPLKRRGRERRERSRLYYRSDDETTENGEKGTSSSSSSSPSAAAAADDDDDDDDDDDKNKGADEILLENSRRMRFNDIQRKRELFAQVERERDMLLRIQQEKETRAYLDQEMIEIKKKLTIESALNEEEDEERIRNAELAAETLCKSLDDAECFAREDIDWDDHEQKWTEFDSTTFREEEGKKISMRNVPWPPSEDILQHMAAFEMRQKEEGEDFECEERKVLVAEKIYKKAFRRANLRWHPDKFTVRYGKYLDENDRDAILARVEEISMIVNSSYEKLLF